MKFTFTIFTVALIALFSFNACTSETGGNTVEATDLIGDWECVAGELNGNKDAPFAKTETSEGAIISFSKEVMEFPLLAAEMNLSKSQPYTLEGSKILFPNDKDLVFDILETKKDTLVLEFALEEYLFKMTMKRK